MGEALRKLLDSLLDVQQIPSLLFLSLLILLFQEELLQLLFYLLHFWIEFFFFEKDLIEGNVLVQNDVQGDLLQNSKSVPQEPEKQDQLLRLLRAFSTGNHFDVLDFEQKVLDELQNLLRLFEHLLFLIESILESKLDQGK